MKRVLVIDDHDFSRTQMVQTLKGSGYEIAGEGREWHEQLWR